MGEHLHLPLGEPDWSTGRWWLMRVGLALFLEAKEQADDWILLLDCSTQIGQEKCLVILGIRSANLPPAGTCLQYQHLQPIHIRVLKNPNQQAMYEEIEAASEEIGTPRAIINDFGSDVHGGVKLYRQQHPETLEIYDIAHLCAGLLKGYLEHDERWLAFTRQVGQTKVTVQQTELAFLAPPVQRMKARYMNLESVLAWGTKTLSLLDQPPAELLALISPERLQEKLGWLAAYREMLHEWSEWHTVVSTAESLLRHQGLSRTTPDKLARALKPLTERGSTCQLARTLKRAVSKQARQLNTGERVVASTEVLESCFGKLKVLEKDQAGQGFTGLVLGIGALFSKLTSSIVQRALVSCPVNFVKDWITENLGITVQAQRRQIYQLAAETKMG